MLAQYLVNKVSQREARTLLLDLLRDDNFPTKGAHVHYGKSIGFHIDLPNSLTERQAEHVNRTFHANIKYLNEERQ